LHRISVRTQRTLRIANLGELKTLGVTPETYGSLSYQRTQEIGDAAAFLGFDGILAPSARWPCQNLVLFTEHFTPTDLTVVSSEAVDWDDWKRRRDAERRQRERQSLSK
jgi:hypothetical protein